MEQPAPRVALGVALRGVASSAIDISDGLLGDLSHILRLSRVGALIETAAALPLMVAGEHVDEARRLEWVLAGGDDYELAFTAPAGQRDAVQRAARIADTPVTRIGLIESEPGVRLIDATGRRLEQRYGSFDHFA
jgi:thiamine-monophosphate kinase